MSWADTYELLVYSINSTFTDRKEGANHIKQAMLVLIDLDTSDELSMESTIQLLPKIKDFYNWILKYWDVEERRRLLIYQINEFTERYKGDLTIFVNNISWIDGCVPYYWAEASEQSRFDTSEWTVCS
jgi:hypothetical protein